MTGRSGFLTRRDFCSSVSAMAVPAVWSGLRTTTSSQVVRSNRLLSIGFNPDTGVGVVEERSSGELWEWHANEIVVASADSFPVQMGRGVLSDPTPHLQGVRIEGIRELEDGFQLFCTHPAGRFCCGVRLVERASEVLFSFEPDLRQPCHLAGARFPGALRPRGKVTLVDTVNGGRIHRGRQPVAFEVTADRCWMRFYAVLGEKSGYAAVLEPSFDAVLHVNPEASGQQDYGWVHMPRMGRLDTTRVQRCRFFSSPSYVLAARFYRQYAMQNGFYRSLKEKLEECPSLEKLFGAVLVQLGYLQDSDADYAGAFRKLKQRGVEKAYVYPVGYYNLNGGHELYPGYPWIELDNRTLEVLDQLGYLCAPWVWLNEILKSSPHFNDDNTLMLKDGSKDIGWKIGELQWYHSHEGRVLEILKQDVAKLRGQFSAAHFDVLNAGPCLESFGDWSYDREADSRYRSEMFALFSGEDRVVGCEQNKDWAVPYKHFGTNKLPGPFGREAAYWPIPLWQLAFHDSVMTTWWEHSTYNDPKLGHDFTGSEISKRMLLDLLTGDLPSICPIGKMYGWKRPGDPEREIFVFRYHFDDPVTLRAIDAAIKVSQFNARHATDDLVHHEFLSDDGMEQQTVFASGTRVRVRLPKPEDPLDDGQLHLS